MNLGFWMKDPVIEWGDRKLREGTGGKCFYKAFSCEVIIKEKYREDMGIINHELDHYRQYKRLFWYHSGMMLISAKYRLKIELEAYTEQVKAYDYTDKKQYDWIVNALFTKYNLGMSKEYLQEKADETFTIYLKD